MRAAKRSIAGQVERDYIMQVVCDSCVAPSANVQTMALECLVKVASCYYDKLPKYMQRIFQVRSLSCQSSPVSCVPIGITVGTFPSAVTGGFPRPRCLGGCEIGRVPLLHRYLYGVPALQRVRSFPCGCACACICCG